ncbi:MAG: PilZ domain-containing protein [Syntrophotaleaceae bacterium]
MTEEQETPQGQSRKHLRSPMIVLNVVNAAGNKSFFGYGKNISRGGLFIGSVNPREPGDRFRLEILPAPILKVVHVECEVVWNRQFSKGSTLEPGMGLKFLDLPAEEAESIDQWVNHHQG